MILSLFSKHCRSIEAALIFLDYRAIKIRRLVLCSFSNRGAACLTIRRGLNAFQVTIFVFKYTPITIYYKCCLNDTLGKNLFLQSCDQGRWQNAFLLEHYMQLH